MYFSMIDYEKFQIFQSRQEAKHYTKIWQKRSRYLNASLYPFTLLSGRIFVPKSDWSIL